MSRVLAFLCSAALLCAALSAAARTIIVDPSGAGDCVTIQAALDSCGNHGLGDTIVVKAGHYPEHLDYPGALNYPYFTSAWIICPSGPDSTTALDIASYGVFGDMYQSSWVTRGLGFLSPCRDLIPQRHGRRVYAVGLWEQCAFRAGVSVSTSGGPACFRDCDFYGPVQLLHFCTTFSKLRFHHAPLFTSKYGGTLLYEDCLFEGGPEDTLVQASFYEDMQFVHCTFDSAAVGILALNAWDTYFGLSMVDSCRFRGLGVGVAGPGMPLDPQAGRYLNLLHSRFERCLKAVSWMPGALVAVGDTLVDCGDAAMAAGLAARIDGLVVEGNSGVALDVTVRTTRTSHMPSTAVVVVNSSFRNVSGTALRMREEAGYVGTSVAILRDNRFERCGVGADVAAGSIVAENNVAANSAGTGFAFTFNSMSQPDTIRYNTSVLNRGDGFVLAQGDSGSPAGLVVARNLAARNIHSGFRAIGAIEGLLAGNDSWWNGAQAYAGLVPDASNLTLDPRMCNMLAGQYTVRPGSPCDPKTPTGPIGALPVGCSPAVSDVEPEADPEALAFVVRPSPARGDVEFVLLPGARKGRVEVIDAQGRRVWSAPLAAGNTLARWRGEQERGGTASAGLYWVRISSAGATRTRHFVWLR